MELKWTEWLPISRAVEVAPQTAGVYEARLQTTGNVVYVGSASDRRRGVSQRLHAYAVGKSPDSGLAGKAANLALTDRKFCQSLVEAAESGEPVAISKIAVMALDFLGIEIRSAATPRYRVAEAQVAEQYPWDQLWNLRRP